MDCKGGLTKLDERITNPRQTMAADMDIVMAYQQLERSTPHTLQRQWVMGHADVKKKDKPETITDREWDNVSCDGAANKCVDDGIEPQPFTPLPGYRAMLKLDGEWVTTHFRACVDFTNTAPVMRDYVMHRLDISSRVFDDIDWSIIGKVRASHRINRIVRTSKMMYRWLPVGHNWKQCNLPSDKCPCCGAHDETFQHMLQCENEHLEDIRQGILPNFRHLCNSMKLPTNFANLYSCHGQYTEYCACSVIHVRREKFCCT
jgi:hypothetical protein